MSKEEILDKYGFVLENFNPTPGSAIKITVDTDKVPVDYFTTVAECLQELYPEYSILTVFKGIDIK